MFIFHSGLQLQQFFLQKRLLPIKTGFVPTMGALHEGHLSLIKQANENADITICSIFVNPTQFNDLRDFDKYPKTIEHDIEMLVKTGCDILFLPSVQEIYPSGTANNPPYELGYLETVLEGKYRPGHFQGVCQVVDRLLEIVKPDFLFLGQKDFQQCMVVQKLIQIKKINTKLVIGATLREKDGLAMSSRNMRLNFVERKQAVSIYESLMQMKKHLHPGSVESMKEMANQYLTLRGFQVDYVEIANAESLEIITEWNGTDKVVALIAAYLNEIRLIDNMLLN
jgi:pantoate--beta-alanine ligase